MMRFLICALFFAAGAEASETPAAPLRRDPPDYPAACTPSADAPDGIDSVTVEFSVAAKGSTDDVRVVESTNPCFEEVAVAAVRSWVYEPRRVNGAAVRQDGLRTKIRFTAAAPEALDSDAEPLVRFPPKYPRECRRRAKRIETVLVEFDVTAEGETANIRVLESTSGCFEKAAAAAVAKWRYRPKLIGEVPTPRRNMQSTITFELYKKRSDLEYRSAVRNRLLRAEQMLEGEGGPEAALAELAKLEEEFGDSFSRVELAAFHQARGVARLKAGDRRRALDDFRACQRLGVSSDASETLGAMILQLEAAIAAEDAAAAKAQQSGGKAEGEAERQ